MNKALSDAKESLEILLDTEQFLLGLGTSGRLTLANTGRWADQLADCRERITGQRREVERLEAAGTTGGAA